MATTIPDKHSGVPTPRDDAFEILTDWYESNLADSDKASDIEDALYYRALADAYSDVLRLLFNG